MKQTFSLVAEPCNLHGFEGVKNFCADNVLDLGSIVSPRTHQAEDPQYTEKPGQTVWIFCIPTESKNLRSQGQTIMNILHQFPETFAPTQSNWHVNSSRSFVDFGTLVKWGIWMIPVWEAPQGAVSSQTQSVSPSYQKPHVACVHICIVFC